MFDLSAGNLYIINKACALLTKHAHYQQSMRTTKKHVHYQHNTRTTNSTNVIVLYSFGKDWLRYRYVRPRIRKYPVSTVFEAYSKKIQSRERIRKVADSSLNSPDRCGRKPYSQERQVIQGRRTYSARF